MCFFPEFHFAIVQQTLKTFIITILSINATIKLEIDDKDVLRPINVFDIAYNTWCESHKYNVGDAQRVGLYMYST
jgi:hypothetical protein